ncbi:MAG TPA: fumarate hydratase [Syntrophomonadaceae bacterium]|nr:fumarate hydratase [Syntrophomonadaceae bacterium]
MRSINVQDVGNAVAEAVIKANTILPQDVLDALKRSVGIEDAAGRHCLEILLENARLAQAQNLALCQDTGLVVVDLELGQEVRLVGGLLEDAVNEGIRQGYTRGYFRKSVVESPFKRKNTGDNTPAIIHMQLTAGDRLKLSILPKGAGSENMGRLVMLKPSQGMAGVKEFVIETVQNAGGNPCPPIIVGVGVGGNMEKAAIMAKHALLREVGSVNADPDLAALEKELLTKINNLGIGPQGLGGKVTALAVHIETYATHIACLPVAVSLGCHSTRRIVLEF